MDCTEAYKEHIMYSFNGFCKGEPMNNDTSKTSHTTAPLDAKPDLVKRIGIPPLTFISISAKRAGKPLRTR